MSDSSAPASSPKASTDELAFTPERPRPAGREGQVHRSAQRADHEDMNREHDVLRSVASTMVAAFEDVWDELRSKHEKLPPVVFLIGRATGREIVCRTEAAAPVGSKLPPGFVNPVIRFDDDDELSTCAEKAWELKTPIGDWHQLDEVYVGGEALNQPIDQIFAKVLREAAILLARSQGEKVVSRQGRYYNKKFWRYANIVGLVPPERQKIFKGGYMPKVQPQKRALKRYAETLSQLENAIVAYRRRQEPMPATAHPPAATTKWSGTNDITWIACSCRPPKYLSGARAALKNLTCFDCGHNFEILQAPPKKVTLYGADGTPVGEQKFNPRTHRLVASRKKVTPVDDKSPTRNQIQEFLRDDDPADAPV